MLLVIKLPELAEEMQFESSEESGRLIFNREWVKGVDSTCLNPSLRTRCDAGARASPQDALPDLIAFSDQALTGTQVSPTLFFRHRP
jgi:hypothetical protein